MKARSKFFPVRADPAEIDRWKDAAARDGAASVAAWVRDVLDDASTEARPQADLRRRIAELERLLSRDDGEPGAPQRSPADPRDRAAGG